MYFKNFNYLGKNCYYHSACKANASLNIAFIKYISISFFAVGNENFSGSSFIESFLMAFKKDKLTLHEDGKYNIYKGAFINYVDRILKIFDPTCPLC